MREIDLNRTPEELMQLLENIKTSDGDLETKTFYINEIEKKLGLKDSVIEVLKANQEGSADPIKLD